MSANYSLPDIKAANAAWAPEYKPVIVITGSTAGIGKSTLETFARHLKGRPAHFVMVGRNKVAAQKIIDSIKSDEGAEQFTIDFFAVDLTLNASAHDLAKELTSKVDKINFLVLSAGTVMLVGGRNETTEGIDIHLATRYYTRWVLTNDLLPLLRNARQAGEPAHMLSVLGPGHHDHIDLNNLGVKTGYGGLKAMYETCTYNDLMVAEFGRRNPDIAFTHYNPGSVNTTNIETKNAIQRALITIIHPVVKLVTITVEQSGENTMNATLTGKLGMNRIDQYGQEMGQKSFPMEKNAASILWEHTVAETKSTVM